MSRFCLMACLCVLQLSVRLAGPVLRQVHPPPRLCSRHLRGAVAVPVWNQLGGPPLQQRFVFFFNILSFFPSCSHTVSDPVLCTNKFNLFICFFRSELLWHSPAVSERRDVHQHRTWQVSVYLCWGLLWNHLSERWVWRLLFNESTGFGSDDQLGKSA